MYEELVKRLRATTVNHDEKCESCSYEDEYPCCVDCLDEMHIEAADAIEELSHYAAQMDKLREDGCYLLQETAGTYGPITMKMPIPEPLSCDDVLAIINGEPPKEETC